MYINVFVKYRSKLSGGGGWSTDTATVHCANGDETLCHSGKPDAPRSGVSERGWERLRRMRSDVTCVKCMRSMRASQKASERVKNDY